MSIINKDKLAKDVAARTGLDSGQSKLILEATLEKIAEHLAAGNEIRLTGFGKFAPVHRAAREGRNPATGESMQIAAKTVPKFSAGAELRQAFQ